MNQVKTIISSKREIKRIEWGIIKRLVILLHNNNRLKKTSLATKSGLAYDKCALYLEWMNVVGLIDRETDNSGFELITLSDEGRALYAMKFSDKGNDFLPGLARSVQSTI